LRLKTRSGTSEVITEPDDLGTPGLAQRKAAKPRKRKDKGTRGKQSKQKTPKKPKLETDKTEERSVLPSNSPIPTPKLSPAYAPLAEPSARESISEPEEAKPFYVIEGVRGSEPDAREDKSSETGIPSHFQPPTPSPYTQSSAPGEGQYYLVFVNAPAQSLVKTKVQIDFDTFPTITIGRDPENVVVIPDQNVSRLHAELSRDGGEVVLKDQQSTNGTYLYDGKEFQQVNESVEVKPNSLIKFGSGTIVKLICE